MANKLTRKEREYLEHKQTMMQAAEKLFIKIGYHETTMDQIAEEAEYSKGTLYNYFENKEHLFFCMLIEKLEIFSHGLKIRIQKQSDIENKIIVMIDYYFDFFYKNAGFFKIAQSEKYNLDRHTREKFIEGLKERYHNHLANISEMLRDSKYNPEKAELLATAITGILNSLLTRKLLTGTKYNISQLKKTASDYILKLIK
jgi:AcrR family transcriptional regulator